MKLTEMADALLKASLDEFFTESKEILEKLDDSNPLKQKIQADILSIKINLAKKMTDCTGEILDIYGYLEYKQKAAKAKETK